MHIESILLAVVRITAWQNNQSLSSASGFFFRHENSLFLVTNRHVVLDENSGHSPDQLKITVHTDRTNVVQTVSYAIPLYDSAGVALWRETGDANGLIDVVALPIDPQAFPDEGHFTAFTQENLPGDFHDIEVGESVRVVGYPLDFRDPLHNLPVMRHAIIASSFSLRFQGQGYFLTDSLLHRGSSGSPVVLRTSQQLSGRESFPWMLLGIHSARLDSENQELGMDERLNLFSAWYSDVLLKLVQP